MDEPDHLESLEAAYRLFKSKLHSSTPLHILCTMTQDGSKGYVLRSNKNARLEDCILPQVKIAPSRKNPISIIERNLSYIEPTTDRPGNFRLEVSYHSLGQQIFGSDTNKPPIYDSTIGSPTTEIHEYTISRTQLDDEIEAFELTRVEQEESH